MQFQHVAKTKLTGTLPELIGNLEQLEKLVLCKSITCKNTINSFIFANMWSIHTDPSLQITTIPIYSQ